MLDAIHRLLRQLRWADEQILHALKEAVAHSVDERQSVDAKQAALREFAHVIGAEENWLARLEGREPRSAIWPDVTLSDLETLLGSTHEGYERYLNGKSEKDLAAVITYVNSAGREFANEARDILLHVALHGQYHRGKVNLLLRQGGMKPAPVDYIAYIRGVPAATTADSLRG